MGRMENKERIPREGESVEELGIDDAVILQKVKGFRFGTDAVLLSHFAKARHKDRIMDLCTGSGIIPVLLAATTKSQDIQGLELQEAYVKMARRSVEASGYQDRVKIHQGDLMAPEVLDPLGKGTFDLVTCNPPYKALGQGILNQQDDKVIARHEVTLTLEGVILASAFLLKSGGRLAMVHRPERLFDLLTLMRKYRIEPKRIQLVAPKATAAPNLLLIEGFKDQKPYLKWEPQLIVYDEEGHNTKNIKEIYHEWNR